MEENTRLHLVDLGLANFERGFEQSGVKTLKDFDVLLDKDLLALGMTLVEIRRLQSGARQGEAQTRAPVPIVPQPGPTASMCASPAIANGAAEELSSSDPQGEGLPKEKRRRASYAPLCEHALSPDEVESLPPPTDEATAVKKAGRAWAARENLDLGVLRAPYRAGKGGGWSWTAKCMCSLGCREGNGLKYRFYGKREREGYSLSISSAGVCSGAPTPLRKTSCHSR